MSYDAFISYSRSDRQLARAVQEELYAFSKPWAELAELRLYCDDTHAVIGDDLKPSVVAALKESEFLVLIASPQSAASRWVTLEVESFLETHSPKTILIVLGAGTLDWDAEKSRFRDGPESAFPKLGKQPFKEEPIYLDLSLAKDRRTQSLTDPRCRAVLNL
jgi:hypothetical protein